MTGLSNSEEEASGRATSVPFLLEDKLIEARALFPCSHFVACRAIMSRLSDRDQHHSFTVMPFLIVATSLHLESNMLYQHFIFMCIGVSWAKPPYTIRKVGPGDNKRAPLKAERLLHAAPASARELYMLHLHLHCNGQVGAFYDKGLRDTGAFAVKSGNIVTGENPSHSYGETPNPTVLTLQLS